MNLGGGNNSAHDRYLLTHIVVCITGEEHGVGRFTMETILCLARGCYLMPQGCLLQAQLWEKGLAFLAHSKDVQGCSGLTWIVSPKSNTVTVSDQGTTVPSWVFIKSGCVLHRCRIDHAFLTVAENPEPQLFSLQ